MSAFYIEGKMCSTSKCVIQVNNVRLKPIYPNTLTLVNLLNLNKCLYRILLSLIFLVNLGMNQLLLLSSSFAILSFQHHLNFLTSKIIDWNQHHFGNIFLCKKRTYARLKGLEIALASRPNAFLFQLEKNLISKYNQILHQEFLFWQLKSRITWLQQGDANIRFFSSFNSLEEKYVPVFNS